MSASNQATIEKSNLISPRQIAFVGCFLLPMAKLLEAPSILAKYADGDLLLPALFHFLLQAGVLLALLYASSKSKYSLFERLDAYLGRWAKIFYGLLTLYFLFVATLPLLDLEKFTYAVFFDTAPTVFSFGFFFLLSAFLCTKGLQALGRLADFSLFL